MTQHVDHPKVPMLYSDKSRVDFELPRPPESAAEGLNRLVGFLQRQYLIILITALSILALGLVYVVTAPPRFTAQTTLIIDTRKVQLFQQQSILGDIPIDSASVESQIEILKSEKVALSVIKTLHLIEDLEFSGSRSGLFPQLLAWCPPCSAQGTPPQTLSLRGRRSGPFSLNSPLSGLACHM